MIPMLILLGLLVLLAVFLIGSYNKLVLLRNRFKNAFAQIDVQLKRRYDLIPNLVETAKGYMSHERETLEAVIQARNQAASAGKLAAQNPADGQAMAGLMGAEGALTGALGKLFALSEAYPDLKANQNMMQLTEELTSTENRSRGRPTTTPSPPTTPGAKPSRLISSRTCLTLSLPSSSRSKTPRKRKRRKSALADET